MESEILKVRKFPIASIVLFSISVLSYIFLLFPSIGIIDISYFRG